MKNFIIIFFISAFSLNAYPGEKHFNDSEISERCKSFNEIAGSHIRGNVPVGKNFKIYLQRDLDVFFYNFYFKKVFVKWDFLRNGATQTGIALPKYYLWVVVYSGKIKLTEGAVRAAAVENTEFIITDFVDVDDIKNKRKDINKIFPEKVCSKIISRISD
jgi:hypothetical protein